MTHSLIAISRWIRMFGAVKRIPRKTILALLAILAVVAGVTGYFLLPYLPSPDAARDLLKQVADVGPLFFFTCMAILPLFWFPLTPFLLLAPAFGTEVGAIGAALALCSNMALSWLVSGKWFRPFFERLVTRFGYSPPKVSEGGMVGLAVMLRITPGVPFPLQNYLLGLAGMPFGKYMLVSVPLNLLVCTSVVLFGDALMKGSAGIALFAIAFFVGVGLFTRWWRGRLKARELEKVDGLGRSV